MRIANLLLAGCVLMLFAAPASAGWKGDLSHAFRLRIGAMCIDNIPQDSIKIDEGTYVENNATWYHFTFNISAPPAAGLNGKTPPRARMSIVAGVTPNGELQDCNQIAAGASRIILQGNLNVVQAEGFAREPGGEGGVVLRFDTGRFTAVIGKVQSGLEPLFGAKLDLSGSKAWIENASLMKASVDQGTVSGDILLETTGRQLPNVKFALGDAPPFTANLVQTAENLKLRIALGDGSTWMESGTLQAKDVLVKADAWSTAPGIKLAQVNGKIKRLAVNADKGAITAEISDLTATGTAADYSGTVVTHWGAYTLAVHDSVDPVTDSVTSPIRMTGSGAMDIALASPLTTITAGGTTVATAASTLNVKSLNSQVTGNLALQKATFASLPLLDKQTAPQATLSFEGTPSALKLTEGNASLAGLALSHLRLDGAGTLFTVSSKPTAVADGLLHLPIDVDVSLPKGKAEFTDDGYQVALEGQLQHVKLKADLALTLPLDQSSLTIGNGGLDLAMNAAVALKDLIAGGTPQLAQLSTDVSNGTPLVVKLKGSTGTISLQAGHMLVLHPVLQLGDDGGKYSLGTNWESSGTVQVDYILDPGRFDLVAADLSAHDIHAVQVGTAPIKASGMTIAAGSFSLASIRYLVITTPAIRTSTLTADTMDIKATSVIQGSLADTKQAYMQLEPLDIFHVDHFQSVVIQDGAQAVVASQFELDNLQVHATKGTYRDTIGTEFATSDNITIAAPKVTDTNMTSSLKIGQSELKLGEPATGHAAIRSISFDTSGPKTDLHGTGSIDLISVDGTFPSEFKNGVGGCPPIAMNMHVNANGGVAPVTVDKGGVQATINLSDAYADVYNSGGYSCTTTAYHHVFIGEQCLVSIAAGCVDWGLLGKHCWGESKICTPEVSATINLKVTIEKILGISLRILAQNASMQLGTGDYKDSHSRVCVSNFIPAGPMIDGTVYVPQVSTSVRIVQDLLNPVIEAAVGSFELEYKNAFENSALAGLGIASFYPGGLCHS